jgi:trk system potassium uptake protein
MARRRVAVIGLSAFGETLARELVTRRVRVLVVDKETDRVEALREVVDEAIEADASDKRALEALRLVDYDAVVLSLGEALDASLLAVLHLRDLKVHPIIAKATSEDHRRLLLHLGVEDAIFPEADMAKRVAQTLATPGMLDVLPLGADIAVVEVAPERDLIGHSLAELNLRQRYGINIVAVRCALRDETIVNPDPSLRITDSHVLVILGTTEAIERFGKRG